MKNKPVNTFRISRFISEEAYGGIILIFATITALIWANSAYYDVYHHIWHELKVGFAWGEINLIASLHHWINDGLMALFFSLFNKKSINAHCRSNWGNVDSCLNLCFGFGKLS
jgi:NhaA family Na+:H+ antiporter